MNFKKANVDAWKQCSLYIRARDNKLYGCCIWCKDIWGRESPIQDACHYISRRHLATKFDELNIQGGCKKCNREMSGIWCRPNPAPFYNWFVGKHGAPAFNDLVAKSSAPAVDLKTPQLIDIAAHYEQKYKSIIEGI